MAGAVRQPIDVQSLERFISLNVPEIKTPIDIKQVNLTPPSTSLTLYSLDLGNRIPHINLLEAMVLGS
jgi:hypothetical protein